MSLQGKLALVTGASMPKGIGKYAALALARDGADVVVTGFKHMEGALSVVNEIKAMGRKSMAVQMDASAPQEVARAFAQIKAELGPVNILVNNAAQMGHNVSIRKTTTEEWDYEIKLCLNSAFYCIKQAWEDMCANKFGRIVNVTSVAGVMGGAGQSSYGAAKAGLIALAKSAALEGARYNITANCVLIGISATDQHDMLPEPVRLAVENRTAFKRAATPQEIADAVAYVVSDSAAYMTGAIMNMMGGLDLFVF
ncbi:MAG TPA: SDR family oxidoreductase [Syntrophorhabdaceae bacterium]|nr:SDR family oxidoreductase [Syntrophorhabdaceae bacterium]